MEGLECDAGVGVGVEERPLDRGWAVEVGEEGGGDVDAAEAGEGEDPRRDEEAEGDGDYEVDLPGWLPFRKGINLVVG